MSDIPYLINNIPHVLFNIKPLQPLVTSAVDPTPTPYPRRMSHSQRMPAQINHLRKTRMGGGSTKFTLKYSISTIGSS